MSVNIPGKYDFVSSENYDDYLKAIDVGMVSRAMASKVRPSLEYIDHGDGKWTQKTISTLKSFEITFKLGETFVENTADGRKVNATITKEGNTFIHKQELKGVIAEGVRTFSADGVLTCVFKAKDVVATRVYKKVA